MAHTTSTVRMGPISLFTLAVCLCLAVMAVLALTTAQATFAAADKQSSFTQDTYQNEKNAQELLADIDGALAPVRDAQGGTQAALAAVDRVLPQNATRNGSTIAASFITESGRALDVQLTIRSDATYEINEWKATTQWTTGSDETLWSPGAQTG